MNDTLIGAEKKIQVLKEKVDLLSSLKKTEEATDKCMQLVHQSTSLAIILLLNKNYQLYKKYVDISLDGLSNLMKLYPTY